MNKKKMSLFFVRALPVIILLITGFASLNLISCGADETETDDGTNQLTAEDQKDLARFVEYVFFPTSPYVDKSWVEIVPEDEVVEKLIDFAAETAAIQQVYTEVYNAWEARDFETVAAYFYPSTIRFVFLCRGGELGGASPRRLLSTYSIRRPWNVCGGAQEKDGPNPLLPLSSNPLLTEFYIRRKNVQVPWREASAKTADKTYIYLTKRGDRWYMNELVVTGNHLYTDRGEVRKYFDDPKYKVPE